MEFRALKGVDSLGLWGTKKSTAQNTPVLIIRHAVGYSNTDIKGKKRRNKMHGKSASETKNE